MKLAVLALVLLCSSAVCAQAQARTLALYLENAGEVNAESTMMMQSELQRLLAPAGISVVWKNYSDRKAGEDFDFAVVGSIEGSCSSPASGPVMKKPVHTVVGLADTAVSAGDVLPFFRLDCSRLVRMLDSEMETSMLGRALARVIGHELYHIVARTTAHRRSGIAKAAFSVRDLIAPELDFDMVSLAQMRPPLPVLSQARDLRRGASL